MLPRPFLILRFDLVLQLVGSAVLLPISGRLLLLLLQSGHEHLFCPLVCFQVVLENPVEEFHQLLFALPLSILNVALERFDVLRRLVEHGYQVVVLVFGLSRRVGHLVSLRWGIRQIHCIPKTGESATPTRGVLLSMKEPEPR